MTLEASRNRIEVNNEVTLRGRIFSSDSSCTDNEFVQITKRKHGTNTFDPFKSEQSADDGSFSLSFIARHSADYQAEVNSREGCQAASSGTVTVLVKVRVTITADKFRPNHGDRIRFLGKVIPKHTNSKVILQRKKGGRWVRVAKDNLNKRSRYRIAMQANWRKERRFRVKWPSTDADHEKAFSDVIKIIVRR